MSQSNPLRRPRTPVRRVLAVEGMETRALLTTLSPAVSAAILQAQTDQITARINVATEVFAVKSEILTIQYDGQVARLNEQSAILTDKSNVAADKASGNTAQLAMDKAQLAADNLDLSHITRDVKFTIGQENQEIKALNALSKQYDAGFKATIKGLNKGQVDPNSVETTDSNTLTTLGDQIFTIDTQAKGYEAVTNAVFSATNA